MAGEQPKIELTIVMGNTCRPGDRSSGHDDSCRFNDPAPEKTHADCISAAAALMIDEASAATYQTHGICFILPCFSR